MIKAAGKGDPCDIEIRIFQEPAAHFQAVAVQEINRGLLEILLENDTAFTPADVCRSRDFLQGYGIPVMPVDIGNHFFLQGKVTLVRGYFLLLDGSALAEQDTPQLMEYTQDFQFIGILLPGFEKQNTADQFSDRRMVCSLVIILIIIEIFNSFIFNKRQHIILINNRIRAQQLWVETNTDKSAAMVKMGISIMQLSGIDDNTILLLKKDTSAVDLVIHLSFYNENHLNILVPVA